MHACDSVQANVSAHCSCQALLPFFATLLLLRGFLLWRCQRRPLQWWQAVADDRRCDRNHDDAAAICFQRALEQQQATASTMPTPGGSRSDNTVACENSQRPHGRFIYFGDVMVNIVRTPTLAVTLQGRPDAVHELPFFHDVNTRTVA